MKEILAIFTGGGIGCLLRYGFSRLLNPITNIIPVGTLTANVTACLILGAVSGIAFTKLPQDHILRLFIVTSFCGGLSTFSTFNHELFIYIKNGQILNAISYLSLSLIICTFGIVVGYKLSKFF